MESFRWSCGLAGLALLLALPAPASAHDGGHHGHSGWHPRVYIGLAPPFAPPWWYYPPYYYDYPPRIVEEPPIYIEREPSGAPPPPGYWYYCTSADAYYPKVETCSEPWVKVPPRAEEGER